MLMLPQAHLTCPIGKTLRVEDGSMFFHGETVEPEEQVFFSQAADLQDYIEFIEPYRERRDLFVSDGKPHTARFWIWTLRQKVLGRL